MTSTVTPSNNLTTPNLPTPPASDNRFSSLDHTLENAKPGTTFVSTK
jgi:hypothetical protein